MLLKLFFKKKTLFIVTGAVNEKNGANGSMLDILFALRESYNVNVITIARPPLIGLIESLLHSKLFSYSIYLFSIYQFILAKPKGIFFIANITKDNILYFKNKYPNVKLMIFQTGDVKNSKLELSKIEVIDYILFQSSGQMDHFIEIYSQYKNKAFLLSPTIKENKFNECENKCYSIDLMKNNEQIIFTIIGSIQDRKNQLQAIKLCKILYEKYNINLKLFVVGPFVDNEYKRVILDFIKVNKIESLVTFTGFKKNYVKYLCNAHIVLSVSKEEGLSTIIRESLFLGKLIIASDILGNRGTLNQDNSIIYKLDGDIESFAEDIVSILKDKRIVYNLMSNAKQTYFEKHTLNSYKRNLLKIVNK